jgi:hypothetical protein
MKILYNIFIIIQFIFTHHDGQYLFDFHSFGLKYHPRLLRIPAMGIIVPVPFISELSPH